MLIYLTISLVLIISASLSGVIFTWKGFGQLIKKHTQYLTTFAGGIFTILTYSMIKETVHLSQSIFWAIGSILLGVLFIKFITSLLSPFHHHHSIPADDCHKKHSCLDARRVMISDTFHNIGDGILLVGAYAVSIHLGLTATIGILLHEIVQEISEFFIYKEAGWTTKKALSLNLLSATSILLGVMLALSVISITWLIAPLMGIATGGFFYVLTRDLIPHSIYNAKHTKTWSKHLAIFFTGLLLMFLVNILAPHSHSHQHQHLDQKNTLY